MKRLENKTAIVTGAAQGIGLAIAKRLSESGARLALLDIDGAQLKKCGVKGDCYEIDITQSSQVQSTIKKIISSFGAIDILVNNAGIIRDNFAAKISEEDWDRVLDVNLKGAFLMCQAVFASMKEKQSGKIINISSRSWLGNIGQANYSASKAGLVGLTRTLALEFARYQINVNAVAPGLIDTPMTQGMKKEALERLLKMQPTGKMGSPEDIAAAVEFLASDDAKFITGQVLHIDGGKSCGILAL